jgi:hypothetical protein
MSFKIKAQNFLVDEKPIFKNVVLDSVHKKKLKVYLLICVIKENMHDANFR